MLLEDYRISLPQHTLFRACVLALAALPLAFTPAVSDFAQENQISVGCVAAALESVPLLIADQERRALANGLIFKFQAYRTEGELLAALSAGTIQIGQTTTILAFESATKDPQLALTAIPFPVPPFVVVAPKGENPLSLSRYTLAINTVKDGSFLAAYALARYRKLPLDKDIVATAVGDVPARMTALKLRSVSAAVLPIWSDVRDFEVVSLLNLNARAPYSAILMRRDFLEAKTTLAQNFLKAYVEGLYLFKTDRELALKYLRPRTRLSADRLGIIYSDLSKTLPRNPEPVLKELSDLQKVLGQYLPNIASVDLRSFVLTSPTNDLARENFVEKLYGEGPKPLPPSRSSPSSAEGPKPLPPC
jgi:ABC-type nitrate/sulfonate/bicarbonate transport system substrate-binding protein